MKPELKQHIDSLINNNPVVLFMKGTKERPQCGFSRQVVEVLKNVVTDFVTIDVLSDPEIRDGIKAYSQWPTIPQLYINGEFIGGCDIVCELYDKNELQKLLQLESAKVCPTINLSPSALEALKNAQKDAEEGENIRITIGLNFEHSLSFDVVNEHDFYIEKDGVKICIDPYSAHRASNLSIDYVTENFDAGFVFTNPNEPPLVKELSVEECKSLHDEGKDLLLIDVRPKDEWERAHIAIAKPLWAMSEEEVNALDKNQLLVLHCHHGGRSKRMAEALRMKGFTNVYNLTGGIDAWSKKIDVSIPVY